MRKGGGRGGVRLLTNPMEKITYQSGATIDTIYLYMIIKINIVGEVMVLPSWAVG